MSKLILQQTVRKREDGTQIIADYTGEAGHTLMREYGKTSKGSVSQTK